MLLLADGYIGLLEENAHIVYPVLGVVVLALLGVGIFQAWRAQDLDGVQKAEFKRAIISELRRNMGGSSAEALSRAIGLEPLKLGKLLEEMLETGTLSCHTNTQRLTVWQLKGLGVGTSSDGGRYQK
jgi:hypothetical protein